MTIGIYRLVFKGTDSAYIGQSINVERRYREHLNDLDKKQSYPKLQQAYIDYGVPTLEIIVECKTAELNTLENEAIEIFDSVNNGFNTLPKAGSPYLRGASSPNAKFSKEDYENAFREAVHTDKPLQQIATDTGVSLHIVTSIVGGKSHTWLKDEYPEEYAILVSKKGTRQRKSKQPRLIVAPDGSVHEITSSLREFARIHGLTNGDSSGHLSALMCGTRHTYKGWRRYNDVTQLEVKYER